jgi:hypothetical protein
MTDGCWKYAGWSTINESVKMEASERVIDSMLNSVRMANGELRDDFTAVLLED